MEYSGTVLRTMRVLIVLAAAMTPLTAQGTGTVASSGPLAGPGNAITEGVVLTHTFTVSDTATITDLDVSLDIDYSFIADLRITINHVATGTSALIWDQECTVAAYTPFVRIDANFDDEGVAVVCPPTGNQIPSNPLCVFDGESVDGVWMISIEDTSPFQGDSGALNSWCLNYNSAPPAGGPAPCPVTTECEPNDTIAAAGACPNTIGCDLVEGGAIGSATDVDVWCFTLTEASDIVLSTNAGVLSPMTDSEIELFDSAGTSLGSNDDRAIGDLFSELSVSALAVGTYYVEVRAATNPDVGTYSLAMACPEPAECYLFLGSAPGSSSILGDPRDILQVSSIGAMWPVTIPTVPLLPIPNAQVLSGVDLYFQVAMINPQVFPNDPVQMSNGLKVTIGGDVLRYGTSSGLDLWATQRALLGQMFQPAFRIGR